MKFNLSASDKWFFYSIPPYVIIGIADIIYKWVAVELITFAWVLWLFAGVFRFRLWRSL